MQGPCGRRRRLSARRMGFFPFGGGVSSGVPCPVKLVTPTSPALLWIQSWTTWCRRSINAQEQMQRRQR
eukprot:6504348-Prorocentrum_lima.AAC.1